MTISALIFAFTAPFGFTCLDAISAFMTNGLGMTVFQVMCFRNVSPFSTSS